MSTRIKKQLIERLKNHGFYVVDIAVPIGGTPDLLTCAPNGRFVAWHISSKENQRLSLDAKKNAQSILMCGGLYIEWDGNNSPESEKEFQRLIQMTKRPIEWKRPGGTDEIA